MSIRVLVTGGRHYPARMRVFQALRQLDEERGIACVIEGGCRTGADAYARDWACRGKITTHTIDADWKGLGTKAGPIRNQQMIDEKHPDVVLAFPGGKGTADMLKRAVKARIEILNGEEWAERCRIEDAWPV